MFRLKDIVSGTLKSLGINKQYTAHSVLIHWQEIVGEEIAGHAWPISLERGTLLLAVNNPVWSHHLMMLKPGIIDKINTYLNEKLVHDIRFQAGNLKKYQNHEEDEDNTLVLKPVKLNAQESAAVWQATEPIQDANLRKKCYYVLLKQTGLKKAKEQAGWQSCKRCSVLVPPGQHHCNVCSYEYKQEKKQAIINLLTEAPWLTYQEACQFVPCSPREFHTEKKRLVHRLIHALFEPDWDRLNEATLVMLMTGIKPDKINETIVNSVISKIKIRLAEKVRRKNYVSSSRR